MDNSGSMPVKESPENKTALTSSQGSVPSARDELEKAVANFKRSLNKKFGEKSLAESNFINQHLKGVLDNMESGRKAVQEKVKFVIPTALATFAATWAAGYGALAKLDDKPISILVLLLAAGISYFGIFACRSLNRVIEATYDFYVASVIHARVVFGAIQLHHHWTAYVDRAVKKLETPELRNRRASSIRQEWKCKQPFYVRSLNRNHRSDELFLDDENWSARILEQWKSYPGTLLDSYQRLLGFSVCSHYLLMATLLGLASWRGLKLLPWKAILKFVFMCEN